MLLDPRTNRTSNSHTLADTVFERLADEIVNGHLRPGHWVSEQELASRMNVSRGQRSSFCCEDCVLPAVRCV